ncbi:hypothetical protein OIV19_08325 [Brucella sp. HL-2]|nr:hypothetical protein [Brucella sp. HL-2]MCV9907619.1 hypothetical protein [Brucella sp. HL-2]
MDKGKTANEAGAIAGFIQGGSSIVAATLPLITEYLRKNLANLSLVWWLMVALCLVLFFLAIRIQPDRKAPFMSYTNFLKELR